MVVECLRMGAITSSGEASGFGILKIRAYENKKRRMTARRSLRLSLPGKEFSRGLREEPPMTKNVIGVFLPGTLTRVVRRIMRAKEAVNALSQAKMTASKVLELSGGAKAELKRALESLELVLGQLRTAEFAPVRVAER
jgi:hypothetical protein